jgi:predicted peptidase
MPIWVIHGKLDTVVDYQRSQVLVDGLQTCGAEGVKFTLEPEGSHDVWTAAYADPALWQWLLEQAKPEAQ